MKAGVLLVIIAILVVLYVVVVFVIGGSEEAGVPLPINVESITLDSIRSRLTRTMSSEHISLVSGGTQDCQVRSDRLLVTAETTCLFELEPSDQWTRKLTLTLAQNEGSVMLEFIQPNAISIEETLAPQGTIGLDIFKNEQGQKARLTISNCEGAPASDNEEEEATPPCTLQIAD